MYTATMNDYKVKKEEMLRQAENYRRMRIAKESTSRPGGLIEQIVKVINQLSA